MSACALLTLLVLAKVLSQSLSDAISAGELNKLQVKHSVNVIIILIIPF